MDANYLKKLQIKFDAHLPLTGDEASDYIDYLSDGKAEENMPLNKNINVQIYPSIIGDDDLAGTTHVVVQNGNRRLRDMYYRSSLAPKQPLMYTINDKTYKLAFNESPGHCNYTKPNDVWKHMKVVTWEYKLPSQLPIKSTWRDITDVIYIETEIDGMNHSGTRIPSTEQPNINVSVVKLNDGFTLDIYNDDHFLLTTLVTYNLTDKYVSTKFKDGDTEYRLSLSQNGSEWDDTLSVAITEMDNNGEYIIGSWHRISDVEFYDETLDTEDDVDLTPKHGQINSAVPRNIVTELKPFKLNARITKHPSIANHIEISIFNHAVLQSTADMEDDIASCEYIVELYKLQYSMLVQSRSRLNSKNNALKDDYTITFRAWNPNTPEPTGEAIDIHDITYIDDAVIQGPGTLSNKENPRKIGQVDSWVFSRTRDKTEYFFKSGKKIIAGTTIQTAVEKFALSLSNSQGYDIDKIKEKLGISYIPFACDYTLTEQKDDLRKELAKLAASKVEDYEDYLARIAITAIRGLSTAQREMVYKKTEQYANDPSSEVEDDLEVAV